MKLKHSILPLVLFRATAFISSTSSSSSSTASFSSNKSKLYSTSSSLKKNSINNNIESMDNIKTKISKAISIGAPAYNAGNIDKCAHIYKETAIQISNLDILPKPLQDQLNNCLQSTFSNSNEEAWAFRKQFDGIMDYEIPFTPVMVNKKDKNGATITKQYTLERFTDRMIPDTPIVVNDNVMGGISQGGWDKESMTFSGNTSLANNGGFSSIRWRMKNVQNWSYAKGIYMKVKHSNPNEHTFRLILKDTTCETVRLANYKNVFCNPSSNSSDDAICDDNHGDNVILLPFESFDRMEQMGRPFTNSPSFNRGAVTELGIMAIKPTVVGKFELKILEWGLYI